MDKYIHDENNGLWYELQGNYYIPCLTIPEEEQRPIGVWGLRHLRYIREYRQGLYNSLVLSGKLNGYLAELNEQAEDMFFRLVKRTCRNRRYHGNAQNIRPNGMGTTDECSTGNSNRNRQSRSDLRITNARRRGVIPAAVSVYLFADTSII